MEILLLIAAFAILASCAVVLGTIIIRTIILDSRSSAQRRARQAQRYAPVERPLLP